MIAMEIRLHDHGRNNDNEHVGVFRFVPDQDVIIYSIHVTIKIN